MATTGIIEPNHELEDWLQEVTQYWMVRMSNLWPIPSRPAWVKFAVLLG